MRRPPALPPEAHQELRQALKGTRTKTQVLRVLAVWLRASLGLNAGQVATALGWSPAYVRRLQSRYRREGTAAFKERERSGGRPSILSARQEDELFLRLRREVQPASNLDFDYLHREVEKAAGRPVSPSAVHRLLDRRGWARHAFVMIPRQLPDKPEPSWSGKRRSTNWSPVRPVQEDAKEPGPQDPGPPGAE